MTFALAMPAASGAAPTKAAGTSASGAGTAPAAGDLFSQLLAMLDAAVESGALTLATPQAGAGAAKGVASSSPGDAAKSDKDKTGDDATDPTQAALSALIAALLGGGALPAATSPGAASADADATASTATSGASQAPASDSVQAELARLLAALKAAPTAQPGQASGDPTSGDPAGVASAALAELENLLAQAQAAPNGGGDAAVSPADLRALVARLAGQGLAALPAPAQADAPVWTPVAAPSSSPATAAAAAIAATGAPATQADFPPSVAATPSQLAQAPSTDAAPPAVGATPPVTPAVASSPALTLAALSQALAKPRDKADDPAEPPPLAPASAVAPGDQPNPLAAAAPVRGSPETVAKLAAQIIQNLDGKTTRFSVGLDPAGLGKVEVKLEINASGKLHAQMNFDNPAAAGDLRGRSGELRAALEQAGFDLSGGSLSFTAGQDGRNSGQQFNQQGQGSANASAVFETTLNLGDAPTTAPVWAATTAASGVDIRI